MQTDCVVLAGISDLISIQADMAPTEKVEMAHGTQCDTMVQQNTYPALEYCLTLGKRYLVLSAW